MLLTLISAGICALLAAVWSRESIRDFLLTFIPEPFDELAENWLPLVLPCLILGLLISAGLKQKQNPSVSRRTPAPCNLKLLAQSVSMDNNNHRIPVSGAVVRLGQDQGTTNDRGFVEFCLSTAPRGEDLVRVSHESYLARFLRYDDPILTSQGEIDVLPKMRIVVLESGEGRGLKVNEGESNEIRSALQSGIHSNEIELLADDALRDDIITKLHQYQEGRALYDPRTIQRVGDFHGATHGLFWDVSKQSNSISLKGRLVSLKTSKIEETVTAEIQSEDDLGKGGASLADRLLARLAEARILNPKTDTPAFPVIPVEGYALYKPATWTLWVSVIPEGISRHFPQLDITPQTDGSWSAPEVHIGTNDHLTRPTRFSIYVIIADVDYSEKIRAYLRENTNAGVDLSSWPEAHCRILGHIQVTRSE